MASSSHVVGRRFPKPDSLDKVAGRAIYGHDLVVPRMLQGKILTGPHAHARIASIDVSASARVPGVRAVLTAASLPDRRFGHAKDQLPLAAGKVRRAGEEVAAVAAETEDAALEALAAIRVEYEPLESVRRPGVVAPLA